MGLPKITLFTLGGTIASTRSAALTAGVVPTLNPNDILAAVPQLGQFAEVNPVAFRQIPSADLHFNDLIELSIAIEAAFANGSDGVVITQGTDTLEESAFALDLLVDTDRPIVITGAMRNASEISPDGPANILAAIQVAASTQAHGLGALVVMNDEIHAARFVRKIHTTNLATFQSPTIGPIGWVSEGRIRIPFRVAPMEKIKLAVSSQVPEVALVTLALGISPSIFRDWESRGYGGLVIEAFGGGHVPAALVPAIEEIAARMPVVLSSRTGSGEILQNTYGFPGSEIDLLSRGIISAGALDGLKSRVLVTLVLLTTYDVATAKSAIERIISAF